VNKGTDHKELPFFRKWKQAARLPPNKFSIAEKTALCQWENGNNAENLRFLQDGIVCFVQYSILKTGKKCVIL